MFGLRKLKELINRYHAILELAVIQGANAVFPVLVFPFLLINLGAGVFSKIALAEVLATYVLIFSLYSFDIIGVQEIISKKEKKDIYKTYIVTLICRLALFFLSGTALIGIAYLIDERVALYLILFMPYPLGMILQSNYYYQAIEDNKPLAIFVILTRCFSLTAMYFLSENNDVIRSYYYVAIISVGYFSSGVLSLIFTLYRNRHYKVEIKPDDVINYIVNGCHLFMANVFVIFYRNSNVLILSALTTPIATATYATAEKFIKCLQAVATPINQFYFTSLLRVTKPMLAGGNTKIGNCGYKNIIWKHTRSQLIIMFIIIIMGSMLGVFAYFTEKFHDIIHNLMIPLSIMLFSVFMGITNFMYGSIGLSIRGLKKEFSKMTALTGIMTILSSFILSYFFAENGAALAYVFAELFLLIIILRFYKTNKL